MHFSKIFRVKERKLDELKSWFNVLSDERKDEAIATFEYENVEKEVFVLFKGNDGENYVIGFNQVNGDYRKGDPKVKINQEHREVMERCLEKTTSDGEILLDLHI